MKLVIPTVVAGILMMAAAAADAQILTGTVIGAVKDESGAALPGVTATATSPALPGGPVIVVTNDMGEYRLIRLNPGVYTVRISLPGFQIYQEEELRVTAGATLERNVTLKVSAVEETVTVSGESPMVDVRQVEVTHTVTKELIENVQNQRYSVQEYAKWTPGVSAGDPSARSQTVNVMGSTPNENSWQLDGIELATLGGLIQATDVDAIEEMQVSTLGASAEFKFSQGAVFSFIGKSGTNVFMGSASAIFQNDSMVSKPIKRPCNCASGETGFSRFGYRDYSLHVGGPIVKDRLWFFGGVAIWERKESAPGLNPTFGQNASYDQDNKISSKFDWKINDRLKFTQTLNDEPFNAPGRPTLTIPGSALTDITGVGRNTVFGHWRGIWTYGSGLTATLSNSTVLTIRASGTGEDWVRVPKSGDKVTPNHTDLATGIQSGGVPFFGHMNLWRHTQSVKVNHYIQGAVEQDLRAGVQFDRDRFRSETTFPSGVQYQDQASAPLQAIFQSPNVVGARYVAGGVWGEDQLTIRNRLTISLGIRWDRTRAISPDLRAVDTLLNPTGETLKGAGDLFLWKDVSPRVGFNLRLTDDGRTVMRGNYNRAYRGVVLSELTGIYPGQPPSALRRYDPATRDYTTVVSVTVPGSNIQLDPNVDAPFTDQYSIGVDRQLARTMAVKASYVYKHGENQLGWKDVGGIYGSQNVILANGQTLTVLPLLNATSARKFTLTNGPGFFNTYHGLLMTVTKRLSNYWQADISYTESKSTGLFTAGTVGQDPNDYINLAGRIATIDRPHMLQSQGLVQIPRIGAFVSANVMILSGFPYAPNAVVALPQGTRAVNIAPPGSGKNRAPWQKLVSARISKALALGGTRKLELIANVNNLLQNKAYQTYVTLNYFNASFAQPAAWIEPRNMNVMTKLTW
jgi:carboxypeptidase family protein/TonB-dependent receptor-like protein